MISELTKKSFNYSFSVFLLFFISTNIFAQQSNTTKPKLVVGIVVDQMRFDHLHRYQHKYGEGGFNRLLQQGYSYKNHHYNYIPTVTAAGHASIYSGSTPSIHGIVGNSWYDRYSGNQIGNVRDTTTYIIGSRDENLMGVSPRNLLANTISDQLRLGSNFQAKVISVSFKDRGAALPGGHTANAAYWHDWQTSPGYFVTSSFYMDKLPDWVVDFNQSGLADEYLDEPWNTLYPIDTYTESAADNNLYERTLRGKDSPTFPYNFKKLRKVYRELNAEYQLLWVTPKGNTLLTDFAKQAIVNESLGADSQTDLLAISYSVPDAAGHAFGPQSVEMQDIYLRLDQDIASLLEYLDQNVGVGAYTVFLTADHGVAPVASYLQDHKLPTGIISIQYKDSLETHLADKYGVPALIQHFDRENIFLDRNLINQNGLKLPDVQEATAQFLSELSGISTATTAHNLQHREYTVGLRQLVQNGFYQKRSGDVIVTFDPGLVMNADPDITVADIKGTGHGTGYAYDTHVPLLWYGWGIQPGSSVRRVSITDIAPTLAMMLNLQLPNGTSGQPLLEIFK
jgi:predicted AlkP superfamily pyrophosphatase or phosphodiesterase